MLLECLALFLVGLNYMQIITQFRSPSGFFRPIFGRSELGSKDGKVGRVETQSPVRTDACDLHLRHQHDGCKDSKLYECPIYRKPARTDLNYIGSIDFESDIGPRHWTMRGVALLCDIK